MPRHELFLIFYELFSGVYKHFTFSLILSEQDLVSGVTRLTKTIYYFQKLRDLVVKLLNFLFFVIACQSIHLLGYSTFYTTRA